VADTPCRAYNGFLRGAARPTVRDADGDGYIDGPDRFPMAVAARADWVSDATVQGLSARFGEGEERAALRRRALAAFRELPLEPNPLYRKYGYLGGVDLAGIDPMGRGPPVPLPPVSAGTARVVHDVSGSRVELPDPLREAGVRIETGPPVAGPESESETPSDRLRALSDAIANRWSRVIVPDRCPAPVRVQDLTVLSVPHEAIAVHRSVSVGARSHLLLSEEVYGTPTAPNPPQRFAGGSTRVATGPGSRVAVLTLWAPGFETVGMCDRTATVGPDGRMAWIWAGFGGYRTRVRNRSFLTGNGCDLIDLQSFFGVREQSYDSAVDLTHLGTDTHGQSITRGVFRDTARGMSRGLVRIEKEARKTVSYISEHAMLLSKGTRSDSIPILEILCRDVKATHSTSVAPVDPEKVFYLESRGVPESEAVRMIGEGFLSHVFERSPISGLRELSYPFLTARWEGRPLDWVDGAYPVLPPMELTGTETEPDWRFDAKLR
jgi:hypothetical protein